MTDSIREKMEHWARYRHFRHGGYGKTMMQRVLEGMPGTNCPTCGGGRRKPSGFPACPTCSDTGRVKLKPMPDRHRWRRCGNCKGLGEIRAEGESTGPTCILCRGAGWRLHVETKVNPAYIGSTYREPNDPVSERIDRLVCELKARDKLLGYYLVIWYEYCDSRAGTQEMKSLRIGISAENYRKRLQRALEWIDRALDDRREVRAIPFPWKPDGPHLVLFSGAAEPLEITPSDLRLMTLKNCK